MSLSLRLRAFASESYDLTQRRKDAKNLGEAFGVFASLRLCVFASDR